MNDEAEVPPGGVEVEKIVVDPKKAQSAQADPKAPIDWFEAGLKGTEQVNEMSEPVHRIEAQKAVGDPRGPSDAAWFCGSANGGLCEEKTTGDKKKAYGVKSQLRNTDSEGAG